jgi:3-hydroxybutyryl-CoA dehydrogenase
MSSVSTVGIIGGGFMGTGIAESAAAAGKQVLVYEPAEAALDHSRESLRISVARAISRGKLTDAEAESLVDRVTWTTRLHDLSGADALIEAVSEDAELKASVFTEIDALPDAQFIASNTSSIPIAELASHTTQRERVLGLHFFSPVPVMQLVEVVVALDTSDETVAVAEDFVGELGKRAIRTKDRSGFIVNMLLVPYLMAGVRMYEDGFASREDIDEGMRLGCGHPMGPLTLCDFIGLDVLYAVCDSLYEEFKRDEYAPPPLMKRMVAAGRLGRKSGRGFYDYSRAPVAAS